MNPRYRKSKPTEQTFNTAEEFTNFVSDLTKQQYRKFAEMGKDLAQQGFTAIERDKPTEQVTILVDELLSRIDKFCPHIDTLPPKIEHMLLPSLKLACCIPCLPDFAKLIDDELKSNDCDSCGKETVEFIEISMPLGYGVLSFNIGNWCAEKFIG